MNCRNLSNETLEIKLKEAVIEETKLQTLILHLLAEVETRRLYSQEHPSLFEYCVKTLKYSAGATQRRIDTMRAMRLIPEIETKLLRGSLNFSLVSQAQSFFRQESKMGKTYTTEQKKEVLEKIENKSTRECMETLVAISPLALLPQEKRRALTATQTELKVILDQELIKKLDKIKTLMARQNPSMTDKELIQTMADIVLEKIDPEQKALRSQKRNKAALKAQSQQKIAAEDTTENATSGPKKESPHGLTPIVNAQISNPLPINKVSLKSLPAPEVKTRYIPSTVKHYVWLRDKGECTHPGCGSNRFLEYDHIRPYALGGDSATKNIRLLCRTHNQRAAREAFT
jgi:hypothetical protein